MLEAYLQGLSVEGFANIESLREIQYEAACHNSKWDLELATWYEFSVVITVLVYLHSCLIFAYNNIYFIT